MAYAKTNWVNLSSPYINNTNLNHIEEGIYDADQRSLANETSISLLDGRLDVIDTFVGDITAFEGRLDTAETTIGLHETRIITNESDIGISQSDIIALDSRLDTAESNILLFENEKVTSITSPDSSVLIDITDPVNPGVSVNIEKFLGRITVDTDYYVDTTGDDITGEGTTTSPWATIGKAISYLNQYLIDSDKTVTINIANGTYTITSEILINHPCGSCISIVGSGITTTILSFAGTITGFQIKTAVKNISNLMITSTVTRSGYGVNVGKNAIAHNITINTSNLSRGISVVGGYALLDGGSHGSDGLGNAYGVFVSRGTIDITSVSGEFNSSYNVSNLYGLLSTINVEGTANFTNSSYVGIAIHSSNIYNTGNITTSVNATFGLAASLSTVTSIGTFTASYHIGGGKGGIIAAGQSRLYFLGTLTISNNTTGIIAERFSFVDFYSATTTFLENESNALPPPGIENSPTFSNYGSYIFGIAPV